MPPHDHREVEDQKTAGQFSGEDIEFAPFMFDPSSQPVDNPTSNIGFADTSQLVLSDTGQIDAGDMEFEPFMFNEGEALGIPGSPKKASGPLTPRQIQTQPSQPAQSVQPAQAAQHEETTSLPAPVEAPVQPIAAAEPVASEAPSPVPVPAPAEPSLTSESTTAENAAPFAGHAVPMPAYLMPEDATGEVSSELAEGASLPDRFSEKTPTGPMDQDAGHGAETQTPTGPMPSSPTATGPMSDPSTGSGPLRAQDATAEAQQPASAPAGAPTHASSPVHAPVSSVFSGMAGRTRGNTGPLASTLPNSSWSDNSLASIEDFSSVLIAMQAGKRLRQSGPLSEAMLPQTSTPTQTGPMTSEAPATITAPIGQTSAEPRQAPQTEPDLAYPDWAAQAVSGMADNAPAHDASAGHWTQPAPQAAQAEGQGAPAWPLPQSQEETQASPDPISVWTGMIEPQTSMPAGEPLPSWNTAQATQAPEAASWTAAQAHTEAVPETAPEPTPAPAPPVLTSGLADAPKTGLAAIRGSSMDQPTLDQTGSDRTGSSLEPGVADFLKSMGQAINEGAVAGGDIEFENFMFNQGVPAPLPMLSSIDPAAMANLSQDMGPVFDPTPFINPQVEETHEYGDADAAEIVGSLSPSQQGGSITGAPPLPFWLQDPTFTAATGTGTGGSVSQPEQSTLQTGKRDAAGATSNGESLASDVTDLPPIEPFDFSALSEGEEDEPFGFNTEELIGLMPSGHDPMVVTANLEALADLMGGSPGGVPDSKTLRQAGLGNVEMITPAPAYTPMPAQSSPEPEPELENELENEAEAEGAADILDDGLNTQIAPELPNTAGTEGSGVGGWMATVTSNLNAGSITALTGNLQAENQAADVNVEGLDVAPFDYGELDLEDGGESSTGFLESGGPTVGPSTVQLDAMAQTPGKHDTGALPLDEVWSEADGDTSLFMPADAGPGIQEPEMPTGFLRDDSQAQSENSQVTDRTAGAMGAGNYGDGVPEAAISGASTTAHAPAALESSDFSPAPDMVDEAAPPSLLDAGSPGDDADEQEVPLFKARVASGLWGDYPMPDDDDNSDKESQPAVEPEQHNAQPQAEAQANDTKPNYGYSEPLRRAAPTKTLVEPDDAPSQRPWEALAASAMADGGDQNGGSQVEFEEGFTPDMPMPGDITASGPLPSLEGFEDLTAWIDRYPQDMGAHLALASAYTQAGDIDTALRIYRRMLRKSYVSENVLRVVQDELSDLEDLAHQYPRYYQVRGDLLVRQGHRREAIDEYNKLG